MIDPHPCQHQEMANNLSATFHHLYIWESLQVYTSQINANGFSWWWWDASVYYFGKMHILLANSYLEKCIFFLAEVSLISYITSNSRSRCYIIWWICNTWDTPLPGWKAVWQDVTHCRPCGLHWRSGTCCICFTQTQGTVSVLLIHFYFLTLLTHCQ